MMPRNKAIDNDAMDVIRNASRARSAFAVHGHQLTVLRLAACSGRGGQGRGCAHPLRRSVIERDRGKASPSKAECGVRRAVRTHEAASSGASPQGRCVRLGSSSSGMVSCVVGYSTASEDFLKSSECESELASEPHLPVNAATMAAAVGATRRTGHVQCGSKIETCIGNPRLIIIKLYEKGREEATVRADCRPQQTVHAAT